MFYRTIISLLLLLVVTPAAADELPDCGALLTTQGNVRILTAAGSFEQRGFVQGYCLAEDVLEMVDDYALASLPVILFNLMKAGLRSRMVLPEGMLEEATGLVAGAKARLGEGFESRRLGRALDVGDVLLVNAYVDSMASGCSSLSAWGEATLGGPLKGAPALARNLDWSAHPVLLRRQLVIVHRPAETDREPFLSVTFPGLLGCLSCIDASGTGAFLNLGYGRGGGRLLEATRFQPVTMTLRDAIERRDPDGDGKATARDVSGLLHGVPTVGSYGVHVIATDAAQGAGPALVVELNATGNAVRTRSLSAAFGADTLGLTNHLQILDEPLGCRRYRRLAKSSMARDLDGPALWDAICAVVLGTSTIQTMLYTPSTGRLRLWFRPPGFDGDPGVDDGVELDLPALLGTGGTE
ncbi:MAG: hypothetical protein ABIK09_15070 [Pseudomonadota bacterium]